VNFDERLPKRKTRQNGERKKRSRLAKYGKGYRKEKQDKIENGKRNES